MSSHRYDAAVWANPDSTYTAMLLDDYDDGDTWPSAIGDTPKAALQQLQDLVAWAIKRNPWMDGSEFTDPQTITFRVDVRPSHPVAERTVTFPNTVALPVVCVFGKRDDGETLVCFIPSMSLMFDYTADDDLKTLVQQYAQQQIKGMHTRHLSRLMRPLELTVETLRVRAPKAEGQQVEGIKLPALEPVADALDRRGTGGVAWGRDAEVRRLVELVEKQRASVLVVGASGIGKSTVMAAAATAAKRDHEPASEQLNRTPRYWRTSAARLVAGMAYLGQWEKRCEEVVNELGQIDGVLCIDNLMSLMQVGGAPAQSLAAFFAPYVEHGELRMIAEVTEQELDVCRRLLPGLATQMQVLRLDEWPRATAVEVLTRHGQRLAERNATAFEPTTPDLVHRLFTRFLPHQAMPGRAMTLMQDASNFARALGQPVDNDIVLDRFAEFTGLPDVMLRDDLPLPRDKVHAFLTSRVIGQDEPCRMLADLVVTFKAAMNDAGRPVGVVLMCGPTGVGKTESALALGDYLFPHLEPKRRLVRVDMSEYAGPGAAARFLSQRDGEPSELIRRVREQPFSILLLDEIEKADPEVFDLLLGVLDEGRLVDTFGRVTDFRSSFILMTSNILGDVTGPFGFGGHAAVDESSEVLDVFRPEFFNRLDAVLRYHALTADAMADVARLHLGHIAKRQGMASKNLSLSFTDALVRHIATHGFEPRYGARPMQRLIESFVVTPLAQRLVNEPDLRDATIEIDTADSNAVIRVVH